MRKNYVIFVCLFLVLVPALVWVGWTFGIEPLKRVLPGITAMNPLAGLCIVSLGLGLYLAKDEERSKEHAFISRVLGGLVVLVGAIMLLKYFTGIDSGIDRIFFTSKLGTNRLAPNTALNLIITGISLILIDITVRGRRPSQYLAVLSLCLTGLAIVGYSYGVRSFYGVGTYVPMALNTATCYILFSTGLLHARPDRGGMKIVTAPSVGGIISRLILAAVAIPFGLGAVGVFFYHRGAYEFAFGIALIVTGTILLSTALIWTSGLLLYNADLIRNEVGERLAKRTEELEASSEDIRNKNVALEENKLAVLNILEDLEAEKKKVENERIKDEALLASIGEGMVAVDITGTVIKANEQAQQLLGWKSEQLLGENWFERVPMLDSRNQPIALEKRPVRIALAVGKRVMNGDYLFMRKDTTVFPAFMTASPIIQGDKATGAILVFRDITHEREVDKAKSEFVSLASHQLRTPLSAINWYTEMLLAGDAGEINKEQRKYLDEVYRGNQRMVELVNSLLNVSRIDLGTFSVEPEPTNITEIADSVLKELKPQSSEKKLRVEVEYDANIPTMNLDPKLIRMILQNLLSNSVKYTPEKGAVRLCITIESRPHKHLQIVVADTGYGIPADQTDKIFTKLFRADNVMEKDTEGTGLGLYLVKSILETTGGTISFKSRKDKGTQFFVTLPMSGMQMRSGNKGLT
jgi:PAS domain S-box-containing protein